MDRDDFKAFLPGPSRTVVGIQHRAEIDAPALVTGLSHKTLSEVGFHVNIWEIRRVCYLA